MAHRSIIDIRMAILLAHRVLRKYCRDPRTALQFQALNDKQTGQAENTNQQENSARWWRHVYLFFGIKMDRQPNGALGHLLNNMKYTSRQE